MILELQSNDGKGIFVTLTYNEEHVPVIPDCDENGEVIDDVPPSLYTLNKRDLQLFFKRFRKHFSNHKIRYYACGEYGKRPRDGRPRRPHYHAIIFGIGLDDFADIEIVGVNELNQVYYTSKELQEIWSDKDGCIGYVGLSEVSYLTCAYVSRYCAKKAFSVDEPENSLPEFTLMSRRPGIGKNYLEDNPDCLDKKKIYIADQNGSVEVGVPKYFLKQLKLTDESKYNKIVSERKHLSLDKELLKLSNTSLPYLDLMELEERSRINKTKILFNREEVLK